MLMAYLRTWHAPACCHRGLAPVLLFLEQAGKGKIRVVASLLLLAPPRNSNGDGDAGRCHHVSLSNPSSTYSTCGSCTHLSVPSALINHDLPACKPSYSSSIQLFIFTFFFLSHVSFVSGSLHLYHTSVGGADERYRTATFCAPPWICIRSFH